MLGTHAEHQLAGARRTRRQRDDRAGQLEARAIDLPDHQVHRRRTDEAGDEHRFGPRIDRLRRADLLDHPLVHHDHPLRKRHRLDLVVGDEQRGDAELGMQLADLDAGLRAQLGVEVRQRLVEEEDLRFAHDGSAHRHTLALTAGELARAPLQQRAQLEDTRGLAHARIDLGLGQLRDLQPIGHVVVHAHVRIERVVLEDHRDVALGGLDVVDHPPADRDLAAADLLQPGDHPQQRALAAARGPDDHDELAVGDLGVDAVDHPVRGRAPAVLLEHLADRERTHVISPRRPGP